MTDLQQCGTNEKLEAYLRYFNKDGMKTGELCSSYRFSYARATRERFAIPHVEVADQLNSATYPFIVY